MDRKKLVIEAVAGATAAVAVAVLVDQVEQLRRRNREPREARPDGAARGWGQALLQFIALRISFRVAMSGARLLATAVSKTV